MQACNLCKCSYSVCNMGNFQAKFSLCRWLGGYLLFWTGLSSFSFHCMKNAYGKKKTMCKCFFHIEIILIKHFLWLWLISHLFPFSVCSKDTWKNSDQYPVKRSLESKTFLQSVVFVEFVTVCINKGIITAETQKTENLKVDRTETFNKKPMTL